MARKIEKPSKELIREGQIRIFNPKKGFRCEIKTISYDGANPVYVNAKVLEAPLECKNMVGHIITMAYKDAMQKVI